MSKFDFQFQKNASNQSVTAGLAMFETQKKAGIQQGSQAGTVKTARKYIDDAMDLVVSLDYNAARAMLDEALSIYPEDIVLLRLSGDVYLQQDDKDNALLTYMTAMGVNPLDTQVLNSIGSLLGLMGNSHDAKGFFQAAHNTDPSDAYSGYNWAHNSMKDSDWSFFDRLPQILRLGDRCPLDVQPFTLLGLTDDPALHKVRVKARCRDLMKRIKENKRFSRTSVHGRKIRIGFFSDDFRDHATMLLMGRFFDLIDRERFEVIIYDYGSSGNSAVRLQVEESADIYHNVRDISDHEMAELARKDGVDIAIDMKTYTKGARLAAFAERVAPVQVAFLGYPGTSGLPTMDYFIGDEITVPPSLRQHFSEKILYMPNCYQVNDNTREHSPDVPTRAELGLPEDAFVFCSLNNPNKVTPAEFDVWTKLLHNVPDSVLWLFAPTITIQENLLREAKARGIGPERLVFAARVSMVEHVSRMGRADLFLDAFNCNAHTTASEAVWSGLPIVTKAGKQFAARVAASIVTAIGCPDLVTETKEEYYDLAYKLATDRDALNEIKQRLKDNLWTTPLYDSEQYVRDFENLMEKAILRYEEGYKPKHLSLN
ncbi:UDP-N-acetylglucosamine-peptide N-acetylglucosaminyltransferase [Phaeobacter gallaeciensis]|uniref:O-linked N-acetylglucosamine transferase, SPINDLY family protein n=1 Tax=Phaeobacter gallaeciensis TaxID=60890 RepID=UPI00237F8B82|nr:UDP-N-acetylglucosamine-peptide N-acetylglucosaminyltransferase [Phaeobacter gallaeciensis]MDE4096577.1 UDP-N-acetylglucosamine-peptide N-acetylglucosaminyltransferase [Phaeobacter gallaeciensis]MDE4105388.1 UDP-N-acetylglucosamine-peptide N-acetylglucosaminyltransferase [Phaeobacter gallaeciensis]MDE4109844.1 UDP-N-acetylglucosamine-peptide N-acetylglucosaminyltransferase [Phaeobacter gallaeciensis]MDE4114312.1 UDP-N-acetylglucosamine-peptide N-acetylglucosaminyltransferase [Phaeobacter gal